MSSEIDRLIREQARDAATFRVYSTGLNTEYAGRGRQLVTDPRHGRVWFYVNHRCRCSKCRRAIADYRQQRRVAGKEPWK